MPNSKTEKEYILERIQTLYGERLDEEQLSSVEASLDPMIDVLETIRNFPLKNSDEPYNIFVPYRKDRN